MTNSIVSQKISKNISKWAVAIVTGAMLWGAGAGALNVTAAHAEDAQQVVLAGGNTWPGAVDTDGNTWPGAVCTDGNTWPGAVCTDGNTWPGV
ncbi:hypothetical protein HS041_14980 [Planomonospora sp. ID67723]|uniref:hypothetical protein n=1 Tax=Planomonospora sp. ID67723 TaxID=2738134 RepID=UPI0018C40143|nr:hypothetical protein [Planomonospora sp. ID67723]MBG0829074.1 hypothetical protein [Planomonospora sp. ID67723]